MFPWQRVHSATAYETGVVYVVSLVDDEVLLRQSTGRCGAKSCHEAPA
jgi:hypothetical protein